MKRKPGQRPEAKATNSNILIILAEGPMTVKGITGALKDRMGISQERTTRSHLRELISEGLIESNANELDEYNRTRSEARKEILYSLGWMPGIRLAKIFNYIMSFNRDLLREFMLSSWYREYATVTALKFGDAARFVMVEDFNEGMSYREASEYLKSLQTSNLPIRTPTRLLKAAEDELRKTSSEVVRKHLISHISELKGEDYISDEQYSNRNTQLMINEKLRRNLDYSMRKGMIRGFERNPPLDAIFGIIGESEESQWGSILTRVITTFPDSANVFFNWMLSAKKDLHPLDGSGDELIDYFIRMLRTKKKEWKEEMRQGIESGQTGKEGIWFYPVPGYEAVIEVLCYSIEAADLSEGIISIGALGFYLSEKAFDNVLKIEIEGMLVEKKMNRPYKL